MALTYAQLTQLIEDYIQQADAVFTGDLPLIIQQAEDRILKSVTIPAFLRSQTGSFVIGNRLLGLPTDLLAPSMLTVQDTNNNNVFRSLIKREASLIYEMWGNDTLGLPRYYAFYDETCFIVGPTPDQNYPLEIMYFYRPTSIVNVGIGNYTWLSKNAENALLYACLLEAYNYMKGDKDVMATYQQSYDLALRGLQRLGEGQDHRDDFTDNKIAVPVPQ